MWRVDILARAFDIYVEIRGEYYDGNYGEREANLIVDIAFTFFGEHVKIHFHFHFHLRCRVCRSLPEGSADIGELDAV